MINNVFIKKGMLRDLDSHGTVYDECYLSMFNKPIIGLNESIMCLHFVYLTKVVN
jgi:hypothetical protein